MSPRVLNKDKTCSTEDCEKPVHGRELCQACYTRWRRGPDGIPPKQPDLNTPRCVIDGCPDPQHGRGWCKHHYLKWYKYGDPLHVYVPPTYECEAEGCVLKRTARGLCQQHYDNLRCRGSVEAEPFANRLTSAEKFWPQVDQSGDCWIWIGRTSHTGKGAFEGTTAARWAYLDAGFEIPPGELVMPTCGSDLCVRPCHQKAMANNSWKTECPYGHEYSAAVAVSSGRKRFCPVCIKSAQHERRVLIQGAHSDKVSADSLYVRDGGICQICYEPVDASLRMRDPGMKSIDHIIPISRGGLHTHDNTQLAHLSCNWRKGNRV
jgi:5-methylcytosine-specific restriction endonuclease McrA